MRDWRGHGRRGLGCAGAVRGTDPPRVRFGVDISRTYPTHRPPRPGRSSALGSHGRPLPSPRILPLPLRAVARHVHFRTSTRPGNWPAPACARCRRATYSRRRLRPAAFPRRAALAASTPRLCVPYRERLKAIRRLAHTAATRMNGAPGSRGAELGLQELRPDWRGFSPGWQQRRCDADVSACRRCRPLRVD